MFISVMLKYKRGVIQYVIFDLLFISMLNNECSVLPKLRPLFHFGSSVRTHQTYMKNTF